MGADQRAVLGEPHVHLDAVGTLEEGLGHRRHGVLRTPRPRCSTVSENPDPAVLAARRREGVLRQVEDLSVDVVAPVRREPRLRLACIHDSKGSSRRDALVATAGVAENRTRCGPGRPLVGLARTPPRWRTPAPGAAPARPLRCLWRTPPWTEGRARPSAGRGHGGGSPGALSSRARRVQSGARQKVGRARKGCTRDDQLRRDPLQRDAADRRLRDPGVRRGPADLPGADVLHRRGAVRERRDARRGRGRADFLRTPRRRAAAERHRGRPVGAAAHRCGAVRRLRPEDGLRGPRPEPAGGRRGRRRHHGQRPPGDPPRPGQGRRRRPRPGRRHPVPEDLVRLPHGPARPDPGRRVPAGGQAQQRQLPEGRLPGRQPRRSSPGSTSARAPACSPSPTCRTRGTT